ncbi:MAG: HAD hydrolase-like protein [Clostridia bacterium]|nr:HAD hydrolase-like protein [Clostridia bacterium]
MSRYDIAIFDLDGTLLDTTEGILAAQKHTIREMGFDMPNDEELKSFIGPPVQDAFAKAYGLEGPILQEIATVFRNFYSTETLLLAKAYDGIFELLAELRRRGVTPAVATYKREDYALRLLKHFGFDEYTDVMFGGDHENKLKKKDIIEKCIAAAGIKDLGRAVMIGDTELDANGAEAIGIDFIGVTYGFGFKTLDDVKKVKSVGGADSAPELLNYF